MCTSTTHALLLTYLPMAAALETWRPPHITTPNVSYSHLINLIKGCTSNHKPCQSTTLSSAAPLFPELASTHGKLPSLSDLDLAFVTHDRVPMRGRGSKCCHHGISCTDGIELLDLTFDRPTARTSWRQCAN
jgi:hypothetical protein